MRRRDFITLSGGAAATSLLFPLAARAQQNERMRRIGVLMNLAAEDPETKARLAAFEQVLQRLGWTIGQNVRIDDRAAGGNTDKLRSYAAELVALAPDVILAQSSTRCRIVAAGNTFRADRVRRHLRPCRCRLRRFPGSARWQRHRFHAARIQFEREMAGTPQGDRAAFDASGCASRSCQSCRDGSVRLHPGYGAVARGGGEARSAYATPARSSAPSRPSRAPRMAA